MIDRTLERTGRPEARAGVSACPCCGSVSGSSLAYAQAPALLAVCDVLTVKALEGVGKWIVRSPRGRFHEARHKPFYAMHTIWKPEPFMVDKGLHGAWDVVPAMLGAHGCCGVNPMAVTSMLDDYVRDLLITGTPHSQAELRYRFQTLLGIELPG